MIYTIKNRFKEKIHVSLEHTGHGLQSRVRDLRGCVPDPHDGIGNRVNDDTQTEKIE